MEEREEDELRLQKTLLVSSAGMMSLGGLAWGAFLWVFNHGEAIALPFGYTAATALNLLAYRLHGHYRSFRTIQLSLTLLVPFLLQLAMGGFGPGGATVVWSLLAPLGALLFCSEREARWWFAGFFAVLIIAVAVEGRLEVAGGLSPMVRSIYTAMNVGVPTAAAFILLRYFVIQKNQAMDALDAEQQKAERLLLNVLPAEVASVLKEGDETIAEQYEAVSILFADIVGFTRLSEELSPTRMVELLNEVFSYFDDLANQYEVEKIRTIGDNYMVAAGAPRRRPDHARVLVAMALDMNDYLRLQHDTTKAAFKFRIGINSGPAVGGVIGHHKFHYDLWGDAVNVAARMESHGEPGRIQIGPGTHELVKDEFECTPRGEIEIKGKGMMPTWFVEGRRAGTPI